VPGFAKALIGQRVGSQVIAVIPPKDGYPTGQAPTTVPDGSTMVFVFDILGIE
jgi:peptidylprolyl isomerase